MKKSTLKKLLKKINDDEEKEKEVKEAPEDKKIAADVDKLVKTASDRIIEAVEKASGKEAADKAAQLFNVEKGLPGMVYPSMDSIEKMQKTYEIAIDPKEKQLAGYEIIATWLKAWANEDKDQEANRVFKALNEGTSAEGGYLVPAPLANEVWRLLPDATVMRKIARIIPMTSMTLALNALGAKPSAYWVGEYAQKTTTSADFDQKTLTANKLVCLLPITHELIADANINIAQYVINLFVEAIAAQEDKAFFIGSGTGQPRGINAETLSTVNAGATLNFDDIIDCIYTPSQGVRNSKGAAFVGNAYAIQILRKVKDTNGDYIWRDGGMFGGEVRKIGGPIGTLYGYPFYEQNDVPQKTIFFGDWKYYIIGDRQQLTVSKTDEGGDAWRRDATEYKAVERVDGRAVIVNAFCKILF